MASAHEIVGQEWAQRSRELAEWAMQNLVNRKDLWGQYSVLTPSEKRRSKSGYRAMTLPAAALRTGEDMVTLDKLARHFASRRERKPQIIGLHAKSAQNTSRWIAIDIDCHETEAVTAEDHGRRNLAAALDWVNQLQDLGYDPMLFDSNGGGGYHIWTLFREPAPTEDAFALVYSLVSQWERQHLDEEPETFPKRLKPRSMGAWFRLPGLHHTRDHYSRLYSGDDWLADPWLSGHAAIDAMLGAMPGPPPPRTQDVSTAARTTRRTAAVRDHLAIEAPAAPARKAGNRRHSSERERNNKAIVCVDLDGVLASRRYRGKLIELGEPLPGAVEFTRELSGFATIVILSARLAGGRDRQRQQIYRAICRWLDYHAFSWDSVHMGDGKPVASAYIDDRGVACRPEQDGVRAFRAAIGDTRQLCDLPPPEGGDN